MKIATDREIRDARAALRQAQKQHEQAKAEVRRASEIQSEAWKALSDAQEKVNQAKSLTPARRDLFFKLASGEWRVSNKARYTAGTIIAHEGQGFAIAVPDRVFDGLLDSGLIEEIGGAGVFSFQVSERGRAIYEAYKNGSQ